MTMSINIKEDDAISVRIDKIIEEADDLDAMQSKLILLIQQYFKEKDQDKPAGAVITGKMKSYDERIAKNIIEFTRNIIRKYEDMDPDIGKEGDHNTDYPLSKKSKIALKKIIKEFAIYEIYKVMNPKRIAGETKKDNYVHNMMMGGQKRASQYTGGKDSDIRSYGQAEVKRIDRISKNFQRGRG